MTEEELHHKLTHRQQRALQEAMERYGSYVKTVIYNVLRSRGTREDLEELSSDVFYSLWEHAGTISGGPKPRQELFAEQSPDPAHGRGCFGTARCIPGESGTGKGSSPAAAGGGSIHATGGQGNFPAVLL